MMLSVCSQPGGIGNIIGTQGGFDVFDNRLDLSAVRDTRSRGKRRISYEHLYSSHRETYDARGTASSSEPRQSSCSSASLLGRVQVNITRLGDHEQRLSTIRIQDSQVIFSTTGIRLQVDLRSSVAFPETSNIEAQLKIGTVNTLAMVHPYPNTSSPHNLTLTAEYPLSEGIPTNPVPLQFCMQDRRTGSYQESPIGLFSVTPGFEGPIPSGLIKEDTNPTIDCAPSHNLHGTAALTRSFDELRPSTDRAHSYNTSFDYAPSFAQNPLGAQHSTQPSASSGDISTLSQSAPVQSHHVPRDHLRSAVEHQNPSSYWRADGSYCHIRTPRYGYQPQDLREDVDSDDGASEGPESSANPALIRTSTLPQFLGSSQMSQPLPVQEFNPFSLYPNQKAILEIENIRLDRMSQGWNSEEYENKRRLVQFSRTQDGGKIIADFDSLPAEKWEPNMICVSCILWEEKEKHYITSVDTIALLEALVGARFTVEEKNRIRRNLEGFKPETISKAKAESEEFFKLIMQFPSPRPRNIEKDVKVFEWELLSKSLGKIISKYVSTSTIKAPNQKRS